MMKFNRYLFLTIIVFCSGCSSWIPDERKTFTGKMTRQFDSAALWAYDNEIKLHKINSKKFVSRTGFMKWLTSEQDIDLLPGWYKFTVSLNFVSYSAINGVAFELAPMRSDGTTDICFYVEPNREYRLRANYIDNRMQYYVANNIKGETFSERIARLRSEDNGDLIGSELSCDNFVSRF